MIQKRDRGQKNLPLAQYLPSRRAFLLMSGALCLILVAWLLNNFYKETTPFARANTLTVKEASMKDTDRDGVPDWEERLWGTSPFSADTDADGVPDSTEIANQKDTLALQNGFASSSDSVNETDRFARELFVTYAALSQEGALTDSAANSLAQAGAEKSFDKLPKFILYTKSDIKIVADSKVANDTYRNKITSLAAASGKFGTDFSQVNTGIETDSEDLLIEAGENAKVYNTYLSALLKLPVPKAQADNHIRLINNVGYIANTLPQISTIETDVVRGYTVYTVYAKAYQDMFMTYEAIGKQK